MVSFAQNEPAESIEFPTINNNENINLNDTVRCINGQHPDSVKKDKERRRSVREIVKGKNFGFYTDIIYGGIFLIIGFFGWKMYQIFGVSDDDIEDVE
jgi:hypothetical protein